MKADPSLMGEDGAVHEYDVDLVVPLQGRDQEASVHLIAVSLHIVFGEAEIYPDRRERGHGCELTVLRADVGTFLFQGGAGDAANRGGNGTIGEVEPRRLQLGFGLLHRCRGRLEASDGFIQVLLRQGMLGDQRPGALQVAPGRFLRRLLAFKGRRHPINLGLEGLLVHKKEDLSLLHDGPFGIYLFVEKPADPGLDVHLVGALGLPQVFEGDRDIARYDGHRRDLDRAHLGFALLMFPAARKCRQRHNEGSEDPWARTGP